MPTGERFFSDGAMADIVTLAETRAGDLQPWPDYYRSKLREYETVSRYFARRDLGSVLEIGCGNGFTSYLLAARAHRTVAFDLPLRNTASHSAGVDAAGEFLRRVGSGNVSVVGGTAEELPFSDGSFDVVFSEYALQYIREKDRALREVRRVLKPGGTFVAVVPNFMERVYAPIGRLKYLAKRCITRAVHANRRVDSCSTVRRKEGEPSPARAWHEWLLLGPDGAYRSFREELMRHTPNSWRRLFERNGFIITSMFSTELFPLGLFDMFGGTVRRYISKKTQAVNALFGGAPLIKRIGCSLCLISKKETA